MVSGENHGEIMGKSQAPGACCWRAGPTFGRRLAVVSNRKKQMHLTLELPRVHGCYKVYS